MSIDTATTATTKPASHGRRVYRISEAAQLAGVPGSSVGAKAEKLRRMEAALTGWSGALASSPR